ncbi:response regulator transcription factor [Clostridium grantii]|uniref:Stage 0 sporulation protein A homolog n=1 Tax=Clostridium grantii DSM 8605 TaxID=1121316 RepID=A0A1M5UPG5_9CLOT|nr:response regulator transcription factor [Clostridium grantii]SHH64829.1 DNA-binding response regulator, OmpR family, contains REC and winged-helix (wHTH) domain [Clostridium grantii DSM 8605]
MKKNILVVDDEKKIVDTIEAYLKKDGYNVFKAYDGEEALRVFTEETIHLLILDLMLPKISGENICKKIRVSSDVPIIMLTAKTNEENKIEGLSIGADDYVTKPFSARELVSRVNALIRRSYREDNALADILVFNDGDLEIDVKKLSVKKQGKIVKLTTYEFKLLNALVNFPGRIFSREELLEKAMDGFNDSFDRSIDTHIRNIRKKIEFDAKNPEYIKTIYGAGYKFGGE